ncbi:retrotransposon protein, putative, ty1-copia subclass [Tanacetum coccineum]|uniref:Retrotransposon protein, putative, ty1-copia subclass n=1 Tax=Tanacetum coccineum TaxID=301880 RepID=A0ABQ5CK57_9ASTR
MQRRQKLDAVVGNSTTCALPVLNKTIRLLGRCLKEKLSSTNFNDWFRSLNLVLRVKKKLFVIEQPIPSAPPVDSTAQVLAYWNVVYNAQNEVACLMLEKEGKPISLYVLTMKGYVEQLERFGYVLPQDFSVGLIMNGLTSDFAGFVRNYNMHNIGKTIGELHALLIEYEKVLPKKAATPQDDTFHRCKEVGHWKRNCPAYLAELIKKKKQVLRGERKLKKGALYLYVGNGIRAQVEAIGSYDLVLPNGLVIFLDNCHYAHITRDVVLVSRLVDNGFIQCFTDYGISVSKNDVLYFNVIPCNGIYEIDMLNLVANVNSIYNVSNKRAKHNLDSTYLWHCRLAYISKKCIEKLQHDGLLKSTDEESFDKCVSGLSGKITRKRFHNVWGCEALVKRDTPDKLQQRFVKCIFIGYPKEMMGYYFYFPPENKVVVARYAEFLEKNLISQEVSGRAVELEEIQDEDTSPSENTSEIPIEVEGFKPPQEEVVLVRWSAKTHRAPNRLYVKTAFLNGYLDEDIYMVQPEGFVDPKHPRKVCMLQRSIYGLKQASRSWNKRFDEEIKKFSFAQNLDEPLFRHERFRASRIYRDRSKRLIGLSQSAYMDKILKRYRMDNSKHGSIMYLRNTEDMLLVYGGNPEAELRVDCYCDAGFETDRDDIKSQT